MIEIWSFNQKRLSLKGDCYSMINSLCKHQHIANFEDDWLLPKPRDRFPLDSFNFKRSIVLATKSSNKKIYFSEDIYPCGPGVYASKNIYPLGSRLYFLKISITWALDCMFLRTSITWALDYMFLRTSIPWALDYIF